MIISNAASPTAVNVIDAIMKGITPPINNPIKTSGLLSSSAKFSMLRETVSMKAVIIASAASAFAPIAKPLPIAAVVVPSSSRESVI